MRVKAVIEAVSLAGRDDDRSSTSRDTIPHGSNRADARRWSGAIGKMEQIILA